MTRVLVILSTILLLVAAGLGFMLRDARADLASARQRADELAAEVSTQKRQVAALASAAQARAASQARLDAQNRKESHALNTALTAQPDWSSQPVPDAVAAALGVQLDPKDRAR